MAALSLKLQLVLWQTWTSSQITWLRSQLFSRSNLAPTRIPKARANLDQGGTRDPKERRGSNTDLPRMAGLIESTRTTTPRGTALQHGSATPTSRTRPISPMKIGHGTNNHRNRDSTGPQVPDTILRYPTNTMVRLVASSSLTYQSKVIES